MEYTDIKDQIKTSFYAHSSEFMNNRLKGFKCCNLFNIALSSVLFSALMDQDNPTDETIITVEKVVEGITTFNKLNKSNVSINFK